VRSKEPKFEGKPTKIGQKTSPNVNALGVAVILRNALTKQRRQQCD
jgi:hypothetical protein